MPQRRNTLNSFCNAPHSRKTGRPNSFHAVNTGIDDSFEGEETLPEQIVEENTTGDSNKLASDVVVHAEHNIEDEELEQINLDILCNEATSLLKSGDAKGALQLLKEHLHGEAAQHFDSWRISAGAMAAMGLDDHAISAYNHAIGLNPNNAKCYFNLGALHERKGNADAAKKCFANAIEIEESYSKAAIRLAIYFRKHRRHTKPPYRKKVSCQ